MKNSINSQTFYLGFYLLVALAYFFATDALRIFLFPVVILISLFSFISLTHGNQISKKDFKNYKYFVILFFITLLINIFNDNLTPFVIYIITVYPLSLLLLKGTIITKYIKFPTYLFSGICFIIFITKGSIYNIFPSMSVNYVSVVFIMNVVVIYLLELRNKEPISIFPAFLGFVFSSIGLGRSGIICSGILFFFLLIRYWSKLSLNTKYFYVIFLILPVLLLGLFYSEDIIERITNLSILERFTERGVDSPSRDILKREYFEHLNFKNILLGYNYKDNNWFIHYGLNPHNSYIRLHFYFGIMFIPIIFTIIFSLLKLLKADFMLFICLFVILLRAYTDSVIFLLLYDFVVVSLIYISFNKKSFYGG